MAAISVLLMLSVQAGLVRRDPDEERHTHVVEAQAGALQDEPSSLAQADIFPGRLSVRAPDLSSVTALPSLFGRGGKSKSCCCPTKTGVIQTEKCKFDWTCASLSFDLYAEVSPHYCGARTSQAATFFNSHDTYGHRCCCEMVNG